MRSNRVRARYSAAHTIIFVVRQVQKGQHERLPAGLQVHPRGEKALLYSYCFVLSPYRTTETNPFFISDLHTLSHPVQTPYPYHVNPFVDQQKRYANHFVRSVLPALSPESSVRAVCADTPSQSSPTST